MKIALLSLRCGFCREGAHMARRSREVYGILSFSVESINDEDRASLLRDLDVLVQGDLAIRVEVNPLEERPVVSAEDELQLREARRTILEKYQVEIAS
jgi:hypothetical protein